MPAVPNWNGMSRADRLELLLRLVRALRTAQRTARIWGDRRSLRTMMIREDQLDEVLRWIDRVTAS